METVHLRQDFAESYIEEDWEAYHASIAAKAEAERAAAEEARIAEEEKQKKIAEEQAVIAAESRRRAEMAKVRRRPVGSSRNGTLNADGQPARRLLLRPFRLCSQRPQSLEEAVNKLVAIRLTDEKQKLEATYKDRETQLLDRIRTLEAELESANPKKAGKKK